MFGAFLALSFPLLSPYCSDISTLRRALFVCLSSSIFLEMTKKKVLKKSLSGKEGVFGRELCAVTVTWARVFLVFRETP